MKRAIKIALLAALATLFCISCTGCIKLTETITVNEDRSMDFTIDEGVNVEKYRNYSVGYGEEKTVDEVASEITESIDPDAFSGWAVGKYYDGTYAGAKLTYHVNDIDEVSTSEGTLDDWKGLSLSSTYSTATDAESDLYDMSKFVFFYYDEASKVYTLRIDSGLAGSTDAASVMSSMFDEISFTVTLPQSALSNNATEVSDWDKTLTWKYDSETIKDMDTIEVSFSFERSALSASVLIGVGVVLLIIIVVAIVMVRSVRKKTEKTEKTEKTGKTEKTEKTEKKPVSEGVVDEAASEQGV